MKMNCEKLSENPKRKLKQSDLNGSDPKKIPYRQWTYEIVKYDEKNLIIITARSMRD